MPGKRPPLLPSSTGVPPPASRRTLEKAEVVLEGGQSVQRYLRALPTQPVCLECHGEAIGAVAGGERQAVGAPSAGTRPPATASPDPRGHHHPPQRAAVASRLAAPRPADAAPGVDQALAYLGHRAGPGSGDAPAAARSRDQAQPIEVGHHHRARCGLGPPGCPTATTVKLRSPVRTSQKLRAPGIERTSSSPDAVGTNSSLLARLHACADIHRGRGRSLRLEVRRLARAVDPLGEVARQNRRVGLTRRGRRPGRHADWRPAMRSRHRGAHHHLCQPPGDLREGGLATGLVGGHQALGQRHRPAASRAQCWLRAAPPSPAHQAS